MNSFGLEIWDDDCEKVTFYTVRWLDATENETDKFFLKYEKTHKNEIQALLSLVLDVIGTDHGALDEFFNRPENNVTGLPPHGKITIGEFKLHFKQFPLRLFALRINDRQDLVVLFNGGEKSAATAQESKELSMPFHEANAFGNRIEEALYNETIIVDEISRRLKFYDGSDEIIL